MVCTVCKMTSSGRGFGISRPSLGSQPDALRGSSFGERYASRTLVESAYMFSKRSISPCTLSLPPQKVKTYVPLTKTSSLPLKSTQPFIKHWRPLHGERVIAVRQNPNLPLIFTCRMSLMACCHAGNFLLSSTKSFRRHKCSQSYIEFPIFWRGGRRPRRVEA